LLLSENSGLFVVLVLRRPRFPRTDPFHVTTAAGQALSFLQNRLTRARSFGTETIWQLGQMKGSKPAWFPGNRQIENLWQLRNSTA
jgi:hypothetical protein